MLDLRHLGLVRVEVGGVVGGDDLRRGADALRVAELSQGRDAGPQHLPRQLHFVLACSKYLQASASTGKLGPNFGDDIMSFHFRQLPFL